MRNFFYRTIHSFTTNLQRFSITYSKTLEDDLK